MNEINDKTGHNNPNPTLIILFKFEFQIMFFYDISHCFWEEWYSILRMNPAEFREFSSKAYSQK